MSHRLIDRSTEIERGPNARGIPACATARLRRGLALLINAAEYAEDVNADPWTFALSLRELREFGLVDNDLRWLIARSYVEHALEVTEPGEARAFRRPMGTQLTERAGFILTPSGRSFADDLLRDGDTPIAPDGLAPPPAALNGRSTALDVPTWDSDRQELRWRGQVVKAFKVPSPNQETILAAFEEEHWPPRIDDPLPPRADQEPKRRLHDTINSLNRNQKRPLIRFLGDGSGQGVRWEPTAESAIRDVL